MFNIFVVVVVGVPTINFVYIMHCLPTELNSREQQIDKNVSLLIYSF